MRGKVSLANKKYFFSSMKKPPGTSPFDVSFTNIFKDLPACQDKPLTLAEAAHKIEEDEQSGP